MRSLSALVLFGAAFRSLRNGNVTAPALEPSAVATATPANATTVPAPAAPNKTEPAAKAEPAPASVEQQSPARPTLPEKKTPTLPVAAKPAPAAAAETEAEAVTANTTDNSTVSDVPFGKQAEAPAPEASLAQNATNGSGFAAQEADPVPLVDEPPAKVVEAPEPEPVVQAELEPSAADVYAKVNRMLNQRNRQARLRVQAEEAAPPAPEQIPEPAVEKAPEPAAVEKAPEPAAVEKAPEPAVEKAPEPAAVEKAPEPAVEKPQAPVRKAEPMAVAKAELSVEEKREKEFPTDWMKKDVKFNVDQDVMASREDSVEAQVAEQQSWNTKQGQSWIQSKKALRGM